MIRHKTVKEKSKMRTIKDPDISNVFSSLDTVGNYSVHKNSAAFSELAKKSSDLHSQLIRFPNHSKRPLPSPHKKKDAQENTR
jgi:hypothetical protein